MAGRSGARARRTRVYDCNYNMGESYYRPALDRLDRKVSGRPEPAEPLPQARDLEERYTRAFADDDLNSARRRAEKVISEESIFDSRGGRTARGRPLSTAMEEADNEFDEEVSNSLRRIRATKKKSMFMDDVDMESTVANLQSRSRLGLAEKIMESAGINNSTTTEVTEVRRRAIPRAVEERETQSVRWCSMTQDDTSSVSNGAAARARASRARLSDLEEESQAIQQRQAIRERRVAGLRALLADESK